MSFAGQSVFFCVILRFPSTREAEEECHIFPFADIRRGVE
jgi:hypothetical protein